jgi:hypothetical protein
MSDDDDRDGIDTFVDMVITAQYEAEQAGKLSMWTIYNRPSDYPEGYIARRHETDKGGSTATNMVMKSGNTDWHLNLLRTVFERSGLVAIERHPDDDANIVEVWM